MKSVLGALGCCGACIADIAYIGLGCGGGGGGEGLPHIVGAFNLKEVLQVWDKEWALNSCCYVGRKESTPAWNPQGWKAGQPRISNLH